MLVGCRSLSLPRQVSARSRVLDAAVVAPGAELKPHENTAARRPVAPHPAARSAGLGAARLADNAYAPRRRPTGGRRCPHRRGRAPTRPGRPHPAPRAFFRGLAPFCARSPGRPFSRRTKPARGRLRASTGGSGEPKYCPLRPRGARARAFRGMRGVNYLAGKLYAGVILRRTDRRPTGRLAGSLTVVERRSKGRRRCELVGAVRLAREQMTE